MKDERLQPCGSRFGVVHGILEQLGSAGIIPRHCTNLLNPNSVVDGTPRTGREVEAYGL